MLQNSWKKTKGIHIEEVESGKWEVRESGLALTSKTVTPKKEGMQDDVHNLS